MLTNHGDLYSSAHAAASDAHRPTVRTTHMELLRRTLAEDFSPACPRLLLEENPRRILEDRPLVGTDEPIFSPREDELGEPSAKCSA